MITIHAPSVPILAQFPSGSTGVNLAFQLSDKTLKPSYIFKKDKRQDRAYFKIRSWKHLKSKILDD